MIAFLAGKIPNLTSGITTCRGPHALPRHVLALTSSLISQIARLLVYGNVATSNEKAIAGSLIHIGRSLVAVGRELVTVGRGLITVGRSLIRFRLHLIRGRKALVTHIERVMCLCQHRSEEGPVMPCV